MVDRCTGKYGNIYNSRKFPIRDNSIFDEYRKKKPSKADNRRKKNLDGFDHEIHQKLATDVIGVSFDAQ